MTNEHLHYSNAVIQTKSVTMKDAEKYEKELATSQDAPQETETTHTDENPKDIDWAKRYADLRALDAKKEKERREKEEVMLAENAELKKQLKQAKIPAPASDEEVDEWKQNFPKVFDIVRTIVKKETAADYEEMKQENEQMRSLLNTYASYQGRNELRKLHPDADEIEKSPEFEVWLETQRPAIQQLAKGGVEDVAELLSLYKTKMGLTDAAKKFADKEASKAVTKGSKADIPGEKRIWKESELQRISNTNLLEKALAEFEVARQEGRVEYDLSNKYI